MPNKEFKKRTGIRIYYIYAGVAGTLILLAFLRNNFTALSKAAVNLYHTFGNLTLLLAAGALAGFIMGIKNMIFYFSFVRKQMKEKVIISDECFKYEDQGGVIQINWRKIKNIKLVKSFNFSGAPYQSPAEVILWRIDIEYADESNKKQTLNFLKNQFNDQSGMLCEIIKAAKANKIPYDIDKYLSFNPQFKKKCDCAN